MDYLNQGGSIYLEGTNIGSDHAGTAFWNLFGAAYLGQGEYHDEVQSINGISTSFTTGLDFAYSPYSYADIYINRLGMAGGFALLQSDDTIYRAIGNDSPVYRTICSSAILGALHNGTGLNSKNNLIRRYLAFLLNEAEPALWTSHDEIDFGPVLLDNSRSLDLYLQNFGNENLLISSVEITGDAFQITQYPVSNLEFGESSVLTIFFPASQPGNYWEELTIHSNDPLQPELLIPITAVCFETQIISVQPAEIIQYCPPGDSIETQISISNLGGGDLQYRIYVEPDGTLPSEISGGPDQFGYYWLDSHEPQGPEFLWEDISQFGTDLALSGIDNNVLLTLPFPFPFYGQSYQEMRVSTNGYLTFGTYGNDYSNDPIPSTNNPDNFIAPLWDNLKGEDGSVFCHYFPAAGKFVIQYQDWQFNQPVSGQLTFQVHMFASGEIMFLYETLAGDLNSATVGIENLDGTDGLEVIWNQPYLEESLAVRISYQPVWLSLDHFLGSVAGGETDIVSLTLNCRNLPVGSYASLLHVYSNDGHNPEILLPVELVIQEVAAEDFVLNDPVSLIGNYPNPFNPRTEIRFQLAQPGPVLLTIFNTRGQTVKKISAHFLAGGEHSLLWDAQSESGTETGSNIYFYQIQAGGTSSSGKMILLK